MADINKKVKKQAREKIKNQRKGEILTSFIMNERFFIFGKVSIREDIDRKRIKNFIDKMSTRFKSFEIVEHNDPFYYVVCEIDEENFRTSDITSDFNSVFRSKGTSTCIHNKNHNSTEIRNKRWVSGGIQIIGFGGQLNLGDKPKIYCTECCDWKYDESIFQNVINRVKDIKD
jgi:hypothetical protein